MEEHFQFLYGLLSNLGISVEHLTGLVLGLIQFSVGYLIGYYRLLKTAAEFFRHHPAQQEEFRAWKGSGGPRGILVVRPENKPTTYLIEFLAIIPPDGEEVDEQPPAHADGDSRQAPNQDPQPVH